MTSSTANNPRNFGQQFVSATVHLAGAVEIETGHVAHFTAHHIQARIGGVLIYFLDLPAVDAFTAAVAATAEIAPQMFDHPNAVNLPAHLRHTGQDVSLIIRLSGPQDTEKPQGRTTASSLDGVAHVGCKVGGLRLVIRDAEAMYRLTHIAETVDRLATALWPVTEPADRTPEPRRQPAR